MNWITEYVFTREYLDNNPYVDSYLKGISCVQELLVTD